MCVCRAYFIQFLKVKVFLPFQKWPCNIRSIIEVWLSCREAGRKSCQCFVTNQKTVKTLPYSITQADCLVVTDGARISPDACPPLRLRYSTEVAAPRIQKQSSESLNQGSLIDINKLLHPGRQQDNRRPAGLKWTWCGMHLGLKSQVGRCFWI